ncbi:MAG: MFS transporter [Gammaproteobacteria bacterium]|nr:MFS transporter [Gammaproteobacteria bacterium]
MAFFGFSAGIPLLLVFSTLTAWLRDIGVERSTIGFFSWVGITFSIKVLWAPVIDRASLPVLTAALGKRRGWMLLAQVCLAIGIAAMAVTDPINDVVRFAVLALFVAFAAATQDVVIDAWRIEAVDVRRQGAMAATYIFGYRLALLVTGAGALYIADFAGWTTAYLVMAALMSVGVITTLIVDEPEHGVSEATLDMERRLQKIFEDTAKLPGVLQRLEAWFSAAIIGPFVDFFSRHGLQALVILSLVGLYKLSDIAMGVMANPFYIDLGFSLSEIASIAKVFGFIMIIVGSTVGGIMVVRIGLMRSLLAGAILVASTNLLFVLMAQYGPDLRLLALVISADNLTVGISSVVLVAYASSLTNRAYTATQYALFSSLMTLPGKFLAGFSGVIVDATSYTVFFLYAAALGAPAIILVLYLMKKEGRVPASAADAKP